MSNSNSPKKLGLPIFLGSIALIGVVVSAALMQNPGRLLNANGVYGDTSDYTVVLDSSNKYTSGTTKEVTTSSGQWSISFEYTNASALTNGHVTLADGGKLVNTREFISLDYLKIHCDGAGTLRFRTSYDGATWGGYATVSDNEIYNLASNPYYIELTATGGSVNIYQATYQYTCVANPNAEGTEVVDEDTIVYKQVTSTNDLAQGDELLIVGNDGSDNYYALDNSLFGTYTWYLSGSSITVSGDEAAYDSSTHSLWTLGVSGSNYTFKSGSNYVDGPVSGTHYNLGLVTSLADSSYWSISFNGGKANILSASNVNMSFRITTGQGLPQWHGYSDPVDLLIFKKTIIPGGSHTEYDTPVDEIGFTAVDTNASGVYTSESVYSTANGLVVKAQYSDGNETTLSSDKYTYSVSKTVGGTPIDKTAAFGETGTYYVTVTYGEYMPKVLPIEVDATLTGLNAALTTSTYNTADTLVLTDNLTATLSYSDGNSRVVNYADFASYGLTVTLMNPSGTAVSLGNAFAVAGNWTLRVKSAANATLQKDLTIVVSAIPVTDITFSEAEVTVSVGKTSQLTVTVAPSTATNKDVTWSVVNDDPAGCVTVDQTGKITGVSEGTAEVRATAQDGSTVFGTCNVTVIASTEPDTWELLTSADALSAGDQIIIASNTNGYTASVISGSYLTNVTSTFDSDYSKITELNANSVIFTVGGSAGAWTLANSDGELLGASAAKSIGWDSGTTTWTISVSGGDATIHSTESSFGRILYNVNSPRFTTYADTTSTSKSMVLPQIYVGRTSTPIYPTALSLSGTTSLGNDELTQLTPTFTPATTNQRTLTWSSSDEDVAIVSNEGVVTTSSTAAVGSKATITAKAKASATDTVGTITASIEITIIAVPVTGVSISESEVSLKVDGTKQLSAAVAPANASNQNITWSVESANPSGCVTVDQNGLVTAVAEGTATVKVTSAADSTKYATCAVTVTSSSTSGFEDTTMTAGTSASSVTVNSSSAIKVGTSKADGDMTIAIPSGAVSVRFYAAAWKGSAGTVSLTMGTGTVSQSTLTLTADSGISNDSPFTLSGDEEDYLFTLTLSNVTSDTTLTIASGSARRFVVWGAQVCSQLTDPTGISVANAEVVPGKTVTLTPTFTPAGANNKLGITWSKVSGSSTLSIDSSTGVVTASSSATVGQSATFRATLSEVTGNIHGDCTVSVVEQQTDAWTLMFYVCGSNLESNGGSAKSDLQEILSVRSQQPDNVNIVVETGGATSWQMSGVSASELGRWEIDSSCTSTKMNKVESLTNANMGDGSTFQSFLEWGMNNYPAQRYGVFMWNHGGAMDGCCFDDNFESASDGNGLLPFELSAAVSAAKTNCGETSNLEFIAYDACLMAVQDIAEWNSHDFNYMISSQETEWDGGYDYDAWLPTLYNNNDAANADTETVLKKIGDTFMDYYENKGYNDQTQAVYDLSKMAAYKTAWENMTTSLSINSSSKWNTLKGYINQALKYGYDSDASSYNNGYVYDVFDVQGALTAMRSGYSSSSTIVSNIDTVLSKLSDVIIYNRCGSDSSVKGSCGMNLFCPISGYNQRSGASYSGTYYPANYTTQCTNFTNWQAICWSYGTWAN